MADSLDDFITEIENVDTVEEYDTIVQKLNLFLKENEYPSEIYQTVRSKQKYIKNRFSDEANKEKMNTAKENLAEYLSCILEKRKEHTEILPLKKYLENFYMFFEAMTQKEPDKRASFDKNMLEKICIGNEYDLQHFLYAVLKPLYPDIRKETAADSGVGMIRSDLKIPALNLVLEAKCTREKMSLKKLTEEIEADIVHYQEEQIIFYIYDKAKIVTEKQNYENYFNRTFDNKKINIIIQQPISL